MKMNLSALLFFFWFGFFLSASTSHAQVDTYVLARMGAQDGVSTYHYLELQQVRGTWIFPDFVYIDFSRSDYREFWTGAGLKTIQRRHLALMNGGYFDVALGSAAGGAAYFLPWAYATYHLSESIGGEAYYLSYVPLNNAGSLQYVLERAKMERNLRRFKLGAGYAGYKSVAASWQNKPFVTATLKGAGAGDFELWLQRLPNNGVQLQLRYLLSHRSR
jgi:hypothetical protein